LKVFQIRFPTLFPGTGEAQGVLDDIRRAFKISGVPLNGYIPPWVQNIQREEIMENIDRRAALILGLAAASVPTVGIEMAAAQTAATPKDKELGPGVIERMYGQVPSMVPGFKTVQLRDIIFQPKAHFEARSMPQPMICHIVEGELRIVQNGKEMKAPKNFVYTCNTGMKEEDFNDGSVAAVMRVYDLMA
jgi:hypothetical protein